MPTSDFADTSEWIPVPTAVERAGRKTSLEYSKATRIDSDLGFTPLDSDFEIGDDAPATGETSNSDFTIGKLIELSHNGNTRSLRISKLIGNGGMGRVYLANSIDPLEDVSVAVKIAKKGKHADKIQARMETEADVLQSLDHANVVRFRGTGKLDNGSDYIAMDRVAGYNVAEHVVHHQLTLRQKCDLFIKICKAVAYCHRQGIIHRDIKPANILIDQSSLEPVLIDFGIAKVIYSINGVDSRFIEKVPNENTNAKTDGQLVGTIQYMSPEQAKQEDEKIDQRTDVYSLGVLLYEMVAGEPLFSQSSFDNQSFDSIVSAIASQKELQIIDLEKTSAWDTESELPKALQLILEKAVSNGLDERYRSVDEFKRELEQAVSDPDTFVDERRPSLVSPSTPDRRDPQKRPRTSSSFMRNPVWQSISICLVIAVLFAYQANPFSMTCSNQEPETQANTAAGFENYFCHLENTETPAPKQSCPDVEFRRFQFEAPNPDCGNDKPAMYVVSHDRFHKREKNNGQVRRLLIKPNTKLQWMIQPAQKNSIAVSEQLTGAVQEQAIVRLQAVVKELDDGSLREVKQLVQQIPRKSLYRCFMNVEEDEAINVDIQAF